MRKNSKVLFLSLIVLAMAVILAGCGVTVSCPTCESCGPTCQPQECWLEVTSASSDVWGYVWIDGQNSGVYLTCFSTVKVLAFSYLIRKRRAEMLNLKNLDCILLAIR